ncbi:CRISPR-associated helicase Cas3' [Micromonospora sp. WMMA1949]|nr:CRISPR-associated helicase Cas3' [Micromonospora sp. WMMA1949]MCZ7430050.1 CRISPR-associated helicase Cas3' [Micromonospora sp. WMMA1949]
MLHAPTGSGKTAIILAWLWRRLHGPDPESTPRRLVFALPQRTLVEQVSREVDLWLGRLGLVDTVALHVVMGGAGGSQRAWRMAPHRPAIVVGTVDSLVSKALNRGYGISRATYPIDFALVTNGAHWVIDEIQLAPESTTTLRQLAAFATAPTPGSWRTAEPFALTCMSATVREELLTTVDNPMPAEDDIARIEPADRVGELARRLDAERTIRRLPVEAGDHRSLAEAVQERHRPGTLTLVVLNTVAAARNVHAVISKGVTPCTLLHSRFRGVDRKALLNRVLEQPGERGHIVVATQVIEAGVDLDAAVLCTEAAPWPSVVQRAGRCNRAGRLTDAELWWLPPAKPEPYEELDIEATVVELDALEGIGLTGEGLLRRNVATQPAEVTVLRRGDLLDLFDTTPDLTGADVDVSPYVRDAEDSDVQLAWAQWESAAADNRPPPNARAPETQWRCRVPLRELRSLTKRAAVWRLDQGHGAWTRVTDASPARPGEVLVTAPETGCYNPEVGLDPSSRRPVPECPPMPVRPDPTLGTDPASGGEEAYGQEATSTMQPGWLSLDQHSEDVRDQARTLIDTLQPALSEELREAVVAAAHLHDLGKAHPTWQDALCALADDSDRQRIEAGRPWAKSGSQRSLTFSRGQAFRHELASLLLLDGPLRGLLDRVAEPDLVRYLVLAHHGRLRIQVRGPEDTDTKNLLGLRDGEVVAIPPLAGQPAPELTVELDQFSLGGQKSWSRNALALRDRLGPFVLAYLETVVRIADWRASALRDAATGEETA